MIGDAEHRQVPERIEVHFGYAAPPRRLRKRNQRALVPQIADQAADVWPRIIDAADVVDDAPVVQAESRHVPVEIDVRQRGNDPVVPVAAQPEQRRVMGAGFLRQHDLAALFPLLHEFGQQLGRILQVGGHRDDGVAARLQEDMRQRAQRAKIAVIDDDLEMPVLLRDLPEHGQRFIGRFVVDQDDFVVVARQVPLHHGSDAGVKLADIFRLVETASGDTQQWHCMVSTEQHCTNRLAYTPPERRPQAAAGGQPYRFSPAPACKDAGSMDDNGANPRFL